MGYSTPLGGTTRQLANTTITIHSCKFSIKSIVHAGARTAIIRIPNTNKLVVWSPLPNGPEFQECLKTAAGSDDFEVIANFVPDNQHTIATKGLKEAYPNSVSIGGEQLPKSTVPIDYQFVHDMGNKITNITDESVPKEVRDQFEFIFLTKHGNKELIIFDKVNKTLLEADLMFNVPYSGISEQYPEGGYVTWGLSYLMRYMNSESRFSRWLVKKIFPCNDVNKKVIQDIYNWDFERIIPCHGEVIESNAKHIFKQMFQDYF